MCTPPPAFPPPDISGPPSASAVRAPSPRACQGGRLPHLTAPPFVLLGLFVIAPVGHFGRIEYQQVGLPQHSRLGLTHPDRPFPSGRRHRPPAAVQRARQAVPVSCVRVWGRVSDANAGGRGAVAGSHTHTPTHVYVYVD